MSSRIVRHRFRSMLHFSVEMTPRLRFISLLALLFLLCILNILLGSVSLSAVDVWQSVIGGDDVPETMKFIVLRSRLPQMITALLAGAALGTGGLVMQTLFRNPLADPSILGVNAGAGLGAAIAILCFGGSMVGGIFSFSGFAMTTLLALVGAMSVVFLLLWCNRLMHSNLMLLISGVMISYIVSSVVSLLNFYATDYGVQSYVFWGMGNFGGLSDYRLLLFAACILPVLFVLLFFINPLNALLLGEDYAHNLGISVRRVRFWLLFITGWLSAVVTACCGPIAFIGLAVPHIARFLFGSSNHRTILPATILLGAVIALLCNLLSHIAGGRGMIPVNVLTPIIGVPVVLAVMLRRRGES